MTEKEIKKLAIEFANFNKIEIAKKIADSKLYKPDPIPLAIFMAGSPGAGKTEFSKSVIKLLGDSMEKEIVRIDGDSLRELLPGYVGNNSYLFQLPISILINSILDLVFAQEQTFLLDGTMSNYGIAVQNIKRSLDNQRAVFIFYVYQDPYIAWQFTKAREKVERRGILKDTFIEKSIGAHKTINQIRSEFGPEVTIWLIKKDLANDPIDAINVLPRDVSIDKYLDKSYTFDELNDLIK